MAVRSQPRAARSCPTCRGPNRGTGRGGRSIGQCGPGAQGCGGRNRRAGGRGRRLSPAPQRPWNRPRRRRRWWRRGQPSRVPASTTPARRRRRFLQRQSAADKPRRECAEARSLTWTCPPGGGFEVGSESGGDLKAGHGPLPQLVIQLAGERRAGEVVSEDGPEGFALGMKLFEDQVLRAVGG